MIGDEWIRASLPADWKVARVKDHAKVLNGYPFDSKLFSSDTGHPLVRIRDISSTETVVQYDGEWVPEAAISTGDILVGMDGDFNVARWKGGDALLNQRVCCIRTADSVDRGYLYYTLPAPLRLINEFTYSTTVKHLSSFDVLDIRIPYPPVEQQQLIASFLDRETACIDGLVAEKERMLALLEEKRAALITRVVTCGLNPDVRLKSSGQEWLGDIPAHWEMPRAKGLFSEVDLRTETGEETLLSLRQGKGLVPHNDVSEKPLEADDVIGFKKVAPGQMVINRMRAASGLIAIAAEPGLVSPDYAVFDVIDRGVSIDYFLELFKTSLLQAVFRSSSKGLGTGEQGFLRLYTDAFLSLHFPYPPIEEQNEISAFIQKERAEIQRMENLLLRSIDLAKERRAALITAAVTGQIPLEEMAA